MARYKAKKSSKKGLVIGITSVALAVGVLITAAVGSSGFTNDNPKTWFNGWGTFGTIEAEAPGNTETDKLLTDGGVVDENGNVLEAGEVYAMPQAMTFIAPRATSVTSTTAKSVKIRAQIEPANADVQFVKWESSDPGSVTVTPDEPYSLTATVTCLRRLDESVTITVTSLQDPSKKAVCTIGYLIPPENIEIIHEDLSGNYSGNGYGFYGEDYQMIEPAAFETITPGMGTEMGDCEIFWAVEASSEFLAEIGKHLGKSVSGNCIDGTGTKVTMALDNIYWLNDTDASDAEFLAAYQKAFYTFEHMYKSFVCTVTYTYSYRGKIYKSVVDSFMFELENAYLNVPVSDITFPSENDKVVFAP